MRCDKAQVLISEWQDEMLESELRSALETHLRVCSECHDHARSLRDLSSRLGALPAPDYPEALSSRIVAEAVSRGLLPGHSRSRASRRWTGEVWYRRERAIALAASFLITTTAYLLLLGYLKPVPTWTVPGRAEPIAISPRQFAELNAQPQFTHGDRYTLPRVMSTSGLEESLSGAPAQAIFLVTLVQTDGRASVVEMVSPRGRPDVAAQLTVAVQDISFRPATTSGRPVATQLVLMVEKIDVQG
ncbi:MAG: zf-HC2 domain-containing protein [Acidobacteria bacterium]|nr:zf-HC2 domain-containing protein [Acidobacteriota bacterium]